MTPFQRSIDDYIQREDAGPEITTRTVWLNLTVEVCVEVEMRADLDGVEAEVEAQDLVRFDRKDLLAKVQAGDFDIPEMQVARVE